MEKGRGNAAPGPADPSGSAEEFAANLKRRGEAAQGLEGDLLKEVPLLYGSPGQLEPHGDPGAILARIHRDELLRRHGGGAFPSSTKQSDAALPFERVTAALAVVLLLLLLFFAKG